MKRVRPDQARAKIEVDLHRFLQRVREIAGASVGSIKDGIRVLKRLRKETYEDLNQIQHEYAAVLAIEWLEASVGSDVSWFWNPRQTGLGDEPDVRVMRGATVIVSAEVTTSPEPKGVIDKRMRETLAKLSTMDGKKYYFVVADAMAKRAKTKVRKAKWEIEVVNLDQAFLARDIPIEPTSD